MPNSLDEALSLSETATQEITVDYVNKTLIVPSELKIAGVRGDKDSRRLHFRMKKKPDELDLSTGVIEVKYINSLKETGRQMMTDMAVDGDEITFSFLIPATLTKGSGQVSIQVCGHTDSVHWHISPYNLTIGDFIEVSEITEDDPKYDIVTQLLNAYTASGGNPGNIGVSGITQAQADERYIQKTQAFTQAAADNRYIKKGDPIALTDAQKAELKGDKGDRGEPGPKGDDGAWAGVVKHGMTTSDTSVTLNPNEVYIFPEMSSLTIALGTATSAFDEYHFFFASGATATTLTLPAGVKTPEGYSVDASKTYEVSIANGLALMQGWS